MSDNGTVIVNETETTVIVRSPGPAGASAGGTVNSVDVSGGTTGLTFSGGPITNNGIITLSGTLDVDNGGTGATTAADARANLSAAVSGANNDITSMSAVTGGIATPTNIDFAASGAADAERRMAWNPDTGTVQIGMVGGNVQAELGQQLYAYVHNAESFQINKGQPVYLYQATGNKASVKLAFNTSDDTSAKTLGLAAENIAQGANGLVICQGVLDKINTGSYNEGDTLYLGATAGTLTNTKPKAPNHLVYIGVVERANDGAGQIYIRIQNGYELEEIHDVQITSPANGHLLIYNASTGLWKNATLTAGTGISISNGAGTITISAPEIGTVTNVATGTGLTGGPITSTGTISLANTTVSAGSYGSASQVGTFTVDAQGRLTAASNTNIAIANTAVSGLGTMSTQNDTSVDINGGAIDGATIGANSAAAGTFTTVSATTGNITTVNATTIDASNIEVTNIKAKDGTAAASIANSTGIFTISSELNVDNLNFSGNAITSTNANGNIEVTPNGTGDVYLNSDTVRIGDSNANATLTTNGTGDLVLNTNAGSNSGSIKIEDGTNGAINVTPNGTGRTTVTNLSTTSPRITTGINDANGNELLLFTATGSAVNEVTLANAATGNAPTFTASGGDTNIDLVLAAKGTGQVKETVSSINYALASQYDIGTDPNEIPLNQYLGALAYVDSEWVAPQVGSGITGGTGTICKTSFAVEGGVKKMQVLIDLTGLNSGGTAGDIIGVNGTANPCYIAQIPSTFTILGGRMTCLETPAGGDTDIDLYSATEGTGVEDQAITALTETQIINAGTQSAGTVTYFSADPAANTYFYLVGQSTSNATYTAGRFLIEVFGA